MSLREYKKKRDFKITAEPGAKGAKSKGGNLFVVQKHDASRLHCDFRLEIGKVLASWAVPKGFPVEKGERHLAVHVEDHPMDYAHFEGIIPQGQYGGGTVMVWDTGRYELLGGTPAGALKEGLLHLHLHGEKLKGEWTLVRSRRDDEKTWLLIKTGEGKARITKKQEEHSVLSGRTLPQIAKEHDAVWDSNHGLAADERAKKEEKPIAKRAKTSAKKPRAKVHWIEPMKATLRESLPSDGEWKYELKWDGYRAIAVKNGDEVELISRNQKPLTADFPEVREAVESIDAETAVLDGEICALDSKGRPRFQLLQARAIGKNRPPLCYYVFDVLNLDGRDFKDEPLEVRREALAALVAKSDGGVLRFSDSLDGDVVELLDKVRALEMEGVIGKESGSKYTPGTRSKSWIKLKVAMEQEFVVGGFTPPKNSRPNFGSILLGYFEKGKLLYAGRAGSGFNHALLRDLHKRMLAQKIDECPFANLPQKKGGRWSQALTAAEMRKCTWIKPELVAQIRFTEWTEDGSLRHPVFLGLREDKSAKKVIRERAT